MKYYVNDQCIGCGMCEGLCPEIFELVDGVAVAKDVQTDSEKAAEAMESCPVDAIEEVG